MNNEREKVYINGWEYWIDRITLMIYEERDSIFGTHISSPHLIKDERRQILDYIKYGR